MKTDRAIAAAAAAGLALGLYACSSPKKAASTPAAPPLAVTVSQIEMRPLTEGVTATGSLVSREEAAVSSELAGYRIAQVYADEGAWVKRGQPLARLDDTLLRSQVDQSAANLALQEVAAQRAHAEAERVAGLDNQGVLSQEQISERRLAAKSADAQVAVARAALNDLRTREKRMVITAPVSGRVLERTARPGDVSSPGTTLYRIARDGLVELDAELNESDLALVSRGDHARVTLPSGAPVAGVVRFVSPRIDPQSKLGHARIALPVREDLRPGGFARATFEAASHPAPAAPGGAIHFDADGAYVMTVDATHHVHRVPVKTGRRANGWVELVQGPGAGTQVALGGAANVLEGDKVRTAPAPASAASAAASPIGAAR